MLFQTLDLVLEVLEVGLGLPQGLGLILDLEACLLGLVSEQQCNNMIITRRTVLVTPSDVRANWNWTKKDSGPFFCSGGIFL